ncbi:acetylornithine deacetylase/succinyl-diaminopimelate desuccinylase-like protein [Streptomyces sp. SAI-117]|uniref:M20/M25/M40 family metallo-hydrolase n=1 Tax=Streptomyces sp. SAI-117 TaxID=2940546 RepID=UPI0024739B6D|nr:M20/M25/M40 family metallo-hydrolase [Streptomyces sp. SAI-117]MDH6574196.1 acetylornithine deacetylase/succinyl-diaminopimelate desuccinylase-like protein [Streptomyces sp. SAI-117]
MNKGQGDNPVALRDVLAHVAKRQQEYVNRLIDYVSRPSISASGKGVLDVACYIRDRMRDMGLETELIPTAGAPMVLGQWSGSDGPTLLLYGHYDVQPADIADGWVSDPFKPVVRDGRIYGRGTADNKGQHLAQLLAIEAYLSCHERLPCNVKVLLDGEEEIGSPQMPAVVAEHGDLLRADLVVISDGPVDPSGRPMISLGVRGALGFELRATGANAELHSGHWGGVAPDPMWDLVQLLATMKDPRGHVTIDGFYDEVQPLSPAGREALERLEIDVSVMKRDLQFDELAEPRERGVAERRVAWPTLTINGLHGGYGGPGLKSVLPREAVAKCTSGSWKHNVPTTSSPRYAPTWSGTHPTSASPAWGAAWNHPARRSTLPSWNPFAVRSSRHRVRSRCCGPGSVGASPFTSSPRHSASRPSRCRAEMRTSPSTARTRT